MTTLQKTTPNATIQELKAFSYPKLHTGAEWYVGFSAFDPARNEMRRKKIKINFIEKVSDRRKYADRLMKKLVIQLETGWNPWIEFENSKAYHTFTDTCEHYRKHANKLKAEGLLREDTLRDYLSRLKNIEEWNESLTNKIVYIYQFNRSFVDNFLEEIHIGRGNTARTRNNYLTYVRIFSAFLLSKQYIKSDPSEGIEFFSKKKMKKIRTIIQEEDVIRLCDYLTKENKHFLLACYIMHYCFVRRKEMSLLKLSYFNLSKQTLLIPGEISKNGESAIVTLPEMIIHYMIDLKIFDNPSNYYLFSEEFKPGPKRKHEKQFTDYWALQVRKDLNFPVNYQFYSLKDTGITSMLRKYDVITVRDQARHSDIQMTNKYTPTESLEANKLIVGHQGIF